MLAGLAGHRLRAAQHGNAAAGANDDEEIAQVEKLAKAAGLGRFQLTRTEHFLAIGDAPLPFQREALRRCESLSEAFLEHFRVEAFPSPILNGG